MNKRKSSTQEILNSQKTSPMIYLWLEDCGFTQEELAQVRGYTTEWDGQKVYNELFSLYTTVEENLNGIKPELRLTDNIQSTYNQRQTRAMYILKARQLETILHQLWSLKTYLAPYVSENTVTRSLCSVQNHRDNMLITCLSLKVLLLGWIPIEQDAKLRTTLGSLLVCSQKLATSLLTGIQNDFPIRK